MIYNLINDLVVSQDEYRTIAFNKNTVGLSYITVKRNPTTKFIELALVAVSKLSGDVIYQFKTKVATGDEYTALNSLFDVNGDLTPEGYQYAINTFSIEDVLLKDLINGTTYTLPEPEPVVEEPVEEPVEN